ncbi:50S ribosomal protein L23 [Hydrocarboniphaga sp.]|jgi:large subunit ribosomal protein L23|uniref:50S ribosomal protein L23 n=1 Tax=Hydrocarboniphaga sp. TaxID=2033016 RepID=UPI003D0ACE8E
MSNIVNNATKPVKLSSERIHAIILAPVVSEKSTRAAEKHNQAVFKVLRDAKKPEIKAAIEALFKVTVEDVQTSNVKGKTKRFGQSFGHRSDWKKAYVTLAAGQEIDFLGTANA